MSEVTEIRVVHVLRTGEPKCPKCGWSESLSRCLRYDCHKNSRCDGLSSLIGFDSRQGNQP